jgi:oligosaccharide repeat unit polymerase
MLFSPERIAIAGILTYLALFLVAPLVVVHPMSWGAIGFVALCYAAFLGGCLVVPRRREAPTPPHVAWRYSPRAFWLFLFLGVVGVTLRAYDKYILRGVTLDEGAFEGRSLLAAEGAGPIAVVAGVLYPFCYVPLIMWWARRKEQRRIALGGLTFIVFLLPAADALILLSRSPLLVTFGLATAAAGCVLYRGRVFTRQLLWLGAAAFVALVGLSIYVFEVRLGEMNLDLASSILMSAYGDTLAPNSSTAGALSGRGVGSGALTAALPLMQYYLHGILEFGLLWERPEPQAFAMGFQHFAPYVKALSIVGLLEYPDVGYSLYVRDGVFTSFFGPLWTDFGWLGAPCMFLFGAASKLCARSAQAGTIGVMPLYAYFCVIIFFMPVVNFWVSAQGSYLINAFVIVWLSSFIWARRSADRRTSAHSMSPVEP